MADAKRDANYVPTLIAVSNADGVTPVVVWADPTTHRLLTTTTTTSSSPSGMFAEFDAATSCSVHTGVVGISIPASYNGLNLTAVEGAVNTVGVGGTMTAQVRRRRASANVNMLSVAWSIAAAVQFSTTATIDPANDDLATGDILYIDVLTVHSTTAALGLFMTLTFG